MFSIVKGIITVVGSYYVIKYINGQMAKPEGEKFKDLKETIFTPGK